MKTKIKKKYEIELTSEELETLYEAKDILEKVSDFAAEHEIEELEDCINIDDYLDILDPVNQKAKEEHTDSSAWDCPSWYTDEQRRCFYGDFG